MPYANASDPKLPADIKKMSSAKKSAFVKAFNSAHSNYSKDSDDNYESGKSLDVNRERYSFAVARAAMKKVKEVIDESWVESLEGEWEVCEMLCQPVVAFEVSESFDPTEKELERTSFDGIEQYAEQQGVSVEEAKRNLTGSRATISYISTGMSANRHYYTSESVEGFAELFKFRPKIFHGHRFGKDRISPPPDQTVMVGVTDPRTKRVGSWTEQTTDGGLVSRARVRFTHHALGQATLKEAKEDPSSVQLSINAAVYAKKNQKVPGYEFKADIIGKPKFLYSVDNVSYGAVQGAGVDAVESLTEGFYRFDEKSQFFVPSNYESRQHDIENKNEDEMNIQKIEEAFKSLQTRLAEKEVKDKFWEIKWSFFKILEEILIDKDSAYPATENKQVAFDEACAQLKAVIFALDIPALKTAMTDEAFKEFLIEKFELNNEGDEEMFDSVKNAAKSDEVVKLVTSQIDFTEAKIKVGNKEVSIKDVIAENARLAGDLKEEKKKTEQAERLKEKRTVFATVLEELKVTSKELQNVPSLEKVCLAYESDPIPTLDGLSEEDRDRIISSRKTVKAKMEAEVKEHMHLLKPKQVKSNGNSRPLHQDKITLPEEGETAEEIGKSLDEELFGK